MNLNRWLTAILMMVFFLALNPLGAQAEPHRPFGPHSKYHHPHGKAYGWHGSRHLAFDRYQKHCRRCGKGPRHFRHHEPQPGPPPVAYVAPVAPIIGIPYSQPQPIYSQPATPGFSGQLNWNF